MKGRFHQIGKAAIVKTGQKPQRICRFIAERPTAVTEITAPQNGRQSALIDHLATDETAILKMPPVKIYRLVFERFIYRFKGRIQSGTYFRVASFALLAVKPLSDRLMLNDLRCTFCRKIFISLPAFIEASKALCSGKAAYTPFGSLV